MPDVTGFRAKWGVLIPSTNTVVEHDFAMLAPYGLTCHSGRALITKPSMASSDAAFDVLDQMDAGMETALAEVLSLLPDRIVVAMSAELMRRGLPAATDYVAVLTERTGLAVTTAPEACAEALRCVGAERIAIVTPYQERSDEVTLKYFTDLGFSVSAMNGLRCSSATAIAQVRPAELISALRQVDGDDVDALLQVGTNLPAVKVAAEAERWLGKPTIAMNAATVWSALRASGIEDRNPDHGILFRDH